MYTYFINFPMRYMYYRWLELKSTTQIFNFFWQIFVHRLRFNSPQTCTSNRHIVQVISHCLKSAKWYFATFWQSVPYHPTDTGVVIALAKSVALRGRLPLPGRVPFVGSLSAQSGYTSRLKKATPHVFIASCSARMVSTLRTAPAFTWNWRIKFF